MEKKMAYVAMSESWCGGRMEKVFTDKEKAERYVKKNDSPCCSCWLKEVELGDDEEI